MKVYVSELPKSCDKCKFYECETELVGEWGIEKHRHICKINGSLIQGICPLHSISDHDKQVRKEVCEEIKEKIRKEYPTVYANIGESLFCSVGNKNVLL